MRVLSNNKVNEYTLSFRYTSFKGLTFIKKRRYLRSGRCKRPAIRTRNLVATTFALFCINKIRIPWMFRFYAIFKITLLTSRRYVLASFKARWLFQSFNWEIFLQFIHRKKRNQRFWKDGHIQWLALWLSVVTVVLLNVSGTGHQWSFSFKDPTVI